MNLHFKATRPHVFGLFTREQVILYFQKELLYSEQLQRTEKNPLKPIKFIDPIYKLISLNII